VKPPRDILWIEVSALVGTLVGGAVLRYWLSTVEPFDAAEVAILAQATDPERAMRVPFIMMNGVSLFALYVLVRRSAGVPAAFAATLLLQSSLAFQQEALRVRLAAPLLLFVLVGAAYLRFSRPPWRLPRKFGVALAALSAVLALREAQLLVTLPAYMKELRRSTAADLEPLRQSMRACGAELELPLERLSGCAIAWPRQRSVVQQEALWEHQRRLGKDALAVDRAADIPSARAERHVALLDARGAGFIVVPVGPLEATARRVLELDATMK